jgi:DNA-binding transcriptional LysR family regulator
LFSCPNIARHHLYVRYKSCSSLITYDYNGGMELRHLRYFVAVAEELNFSRAAQRLHIAQPALSNQIKALENELGVQLLERTRRIVRLTEAGKTLLADARPLLAGAQTAELHARGAQKGESGTIHIGYVLTAANARLASVIKTFRQSYPRVEPDLAQLPTSAQMAALKNRRLDVGFVRPPVNAPELETEVIGEEKMVLAVASNDPLAKKKRLTWQDLDGKTVLSVHPTVANYYYESFFALCRQHKVKLSVGPYSQDIHSNLWLVSTGYGVTPTTESAREFASSSLAFVDLPVDGPTIQTLLAWRRDNASPILANFLSTVRSVRGGMTGKP